MNNLLKYSSLFNSEFLTDNIEKIKRRKKILRNYKEKKSLSASLTCLKILRNFN